MDWAIEFRLQSQVDGAHFAHVAESRDIVECDKAFDHADATILGIQRGEREGREQLLQHRHELLRIHTVIGRMDVDQEPTGAGVLDREIGVLRRLLGSVAVVESRRSYPLTRLLLEGDIAFHELIQSRGQVLRHGPRIESLPAS